MKLEPVRLLRAVYFSFPMIVIVAYGVLFGLAQSSPDGALTQDYIRSMEWQGGCNGSMFCENMIRFLRTADYLGGGAPTAQILWFGIPLILIVWGLSFKAYLDTKSEPQ